MTRDKHPTHERYLVPLVMTRDKNSHVYSVNRVSKLHMDHYTFFFNDKRACHDKHVTMNKIFDDEFVTFLSLETSKETSPALFPCNLHQLGVPVHLRGKLIISYLTNSSIFSLYVNGVLCRSQLQKCKESVVMET